MSDITDQLAIDADAANRLFFAARTANEFSSEPVPDQTLAAIYETMKMGPTLMNSQPLRITWIKSSEAREAVAATMKGSNARKALEAPALAALSFDPQWAEGFEFFFPHAAGSKAMFEDEAVSGAVGGNNAWLQAGYFIMAVRAAGLAAGPMASFKPADLDAVVNAQTGHRAFLLVAAGWPSGAPGSARLPRYGQEFATRSI